VAAATVAAAASVALAAGMTSPAAADGKPAADAARGSVTAGQRVTLITGDRVVLDAKGRVTGLERAEGREHIPVQIRRAGGHTLVARPTPPVWSPPASSTSASSTSRNSARPAPARPRRTV
jgi:hypothetical protein